MYLKEFNYDANNASLVKEEKRHDANGNEVIKLTLSNDVILIYTITPNGFERIDTNFELTQLTNGNYVSNLNSPKRDFKDYY